MMKPFGLKFIFVTLLFLAVGGMGGYFFYDFIKDQDQVIREKFDGKKWEVPASVYARPLELYPTLRLSPALLEKELMLAGYRNEKPITAPGGYYIDSSGFYFITRTFHFTDGEEKSVHIRIHFRNDRIEKILSLETGEELALVRVDPAKIGSFHPLKHEDRIVLQVSEIPQLLIRGLLQVEDRDFLNHHGISPSAIVRALIVNFKAGKTVQGGSTLTQQLVKNFFLGHERTIKRKIREAVMALLLEYRYSKEEILTAYVNEIFLGQDGSRAVHGFGLASQFYFQKNLTDLSTGQMATLIGMIKGPSIYNPRSRKKASRKRRDVVLHLMFESGVLTEKDFIEALEQPFLGVAVKNGGLNRFPSYLDIVRYQLQQAYHREDLQENGLKILTNLNPQIQWQIEKSLSTTVGSFKQQTDQVQLQGGLIVTGKENGEILGAAGGVEPGKAGFNRVLNSRRQIGSLIKPVVFLTGLTSGYTLASPLLDKRITINQGDTQWSPQNYDKREHGVVPYYLALARSYNLATVRLGMELGVGSVVDTLDELGYTQSVSPYPSLLLGAIEMSPYQVCQIYQTIGSGGFYLPLRAIQSVLTPENRILSRYGLKVEERFSPATIALLTHALERVVTEGTGSRYDFTPGKYFAGKTGTSDETRDSWFTGFSESYISVVWLGRDDNKPTHLTGGTGALQVWGDLMESLEPDLYQEKQLFSKEIVWARVDKEKYTAASLENIDTISLPFLIGTEPQGQNVMRGLDFRAIEKGVEKVMQGVNSFFNDGGQK